MHPTPLTPSLLRGIALSLGTLSLGAALGGMLLPTATAQPLPLGDRIQSSAQAQTQAQTQAQSPAQRIQATPTQSDRSKQRCRRGRGCSPKPNATPSPAASATPSPTASPSALSPLAQQMLQGHNAARAEVGVPPLQWSPQLAAYAQEWANHLAATRQFEHRQQQKYGENLFMGSGRNWQASDALKLWVNEKKDYNYASNSCIGNAICGHYTQVVWKKTTEVGCAVATGPAGTYHVCNYNPPGNYVGQKPY